MAVTATQRDGVMFAWALPDRVRDCSVHLYMRQCALRAIMASGGLPMRYLSLLLALCLAAPAQVAPMLNLVILEGEGATNNIRQRTAREPVVQVEDENHKPIAGAIVVFTLPSNGAGGAFANGARTLSMVSDSKGQAVARGLRPNGLKGQFQIRVNASYQNQT